MECHESHIGKQIEKKYICLLFSDNNSILAAFIKGEKIFRYSWPMDMSNMANVNTEKRGQADF